MGFALHTAATRLRLRRAPDRYRPEVLHARAAPDGAAPLVLSCRVS